MVLLFSNFLKALLNSLFRDFFGFNLGVVLDLIFLLIMCEIFYLDLKKKLIFL